MAYRKSKYSHSFIHSTQEQKNHSSVLFAIRAIVSDFQTGAGELAQVFGSRAHLTASIARMIDRFWIKQNESKNGAKAEIVYEIRKQLKLVTSGH